MTLLSYETCSSGERHAEIKMLREFDTGLHTFCIRTPRFKIGVHKNTPKEQSSFFSPSIKPADEPMKIRLAVALLSPPLILSHISNILAGILVSIQFYSLKDALIRRPHFLSR